MLKHKKFFAVILLQILVAFVIFALIFGFESGDNLTSVTYLEFLSHLESGEVSEVNISGSENITFKLLESTNVYMTNNPRNPLLTEQILLHGAAVNEGSYYPASEFFRLVISIMIITCIIYFVFTISNGRTAKQAMALGAEDATAGEGATLTFSDIAGNEEAKESASDIVDFLKNPEKYASYGARIPAGIVFYGPPGTGKTLMAKAIAGEADVPFYAVSGSDFVQMYVGVGASRIRELFKKARAAGKAVIFIDEIDAIGKKRSGTNSGGNDERDQTLNALLTEMSGFSGDTGIVVLAATNRPDTLDEALMRAGRFDRQIEIGLPDVNARKRILEYHAKSKPLADDVNLEKLARDTVFFSGAMLENLLNEAAIFAAKEEAKAITDSNIQKAYYTVLAGSEKKDKSLISHKEREITAYHEAGHALMSRIVAPENTVAKITIIPSTKGAGGFCLNIPPDKMYYSKREIEAKILVNYAGRVSEELIFGEDEITTGASNDIEKASSLIRDFVSKYCMSSPKRLVNPAMFGGPGSSLDDSYVIAEALYEKCKSILFENLDTLKSIADALIEKETLNEEDFEAILMEDSAA